MKRTAMRRDTPGARRFAEQRHELARTAGPKRSRRKSPDGITLAAERFHFEVTAAGYCEVCGFRPKPPHRLEAHHLLEAQFLRRMLPNDLDPALRLSILYSPANGVAVCDECHADHTSRAHPFDRSLVPAGAWAFAELLDETYGERGATPFTARLRNDYAKNAQRRAA